MQISWLDGDSSYPPSKEMDNEMGFIKKHWKVLAGLLGLVVVFVVGLCLGLSAPTIGAGGSFIALALGWLHPKPVSGATADHASAARTSAASDTGLRDAIAGSDHQGSKLGPILDEGKSLESEGDRMVADDEDLIRRAQGLGDKGGQ